MELTYNYEWTFYITTCKHLFHDMDKNKMIYEDRIILIILFCMQPNI